MLIPVVESHCSCCFGPAGASHKEPHGRVQAGQHYLQSMEESWKNVFLIKKRLDCFVFFFHSSDQNQLGSFSCNLTCETQNNCCHERGLRPARKSLRSWQSMAGQDAARHWSAMSSGSCWSYFPVTRGSTSEWRLPATRLRYSLVIPQASEASSSLTMDFWKVIVVLVFC